MSDEGDDDDDDDDDDESVDEDNEEDEYEDDDEWGPSAKTGYCSIVRTRSALKWLEMNDRGKE